LKNIAKSSSFDSRSIEKAVSLLESMERSTCFVALACAKKLMALTLDLFQTLQLIDLDFSAALTEIQELKRFVVWRCLSE